MIGMYQVNPRTPGGVDDGTVLLLDYEYYMLSGLTKNATFKSNQIREGQIVREEALILLQLDSHSPNKGIKWYYDKIGVDYVSRIRTINDAPRLYLE